MARAWHRAGAPLKRTLLLGGSFNPAHRGHRRISLWAMKALGAEEVWWLVSPGNPLKPQKGMASLNERLRSAREQSRNSPIIPTAIEQQLGTRYTVDTLAALVERYPKRRFIWLMGSDNLAQFHLWRDWRRIARIMPIAVVARPGYDGAAQASRAMGWLHWFVHPARQAKQWTEWRPPALVLLRFDPDKSSATALRRAHPNWHKAFRAAPLRDRLSRRMTD